MGNPAEERPPPSIISVPKLVLVVKHLAHVADLAILPNAGIRACQSRVGSCPSRVAGSTLSPICWRYRQYQQRRKNQMNFNELLAQQQAR